MPSDWLTLALGVLPTAPVDLSVFRAEGGEAQVRLLGHNDRGLLVRMAGADAATTTGVVFALERSRGAAFAVFGTISALTPLGDGDCEVLIEVDEVVRWKSRRRIEVDLLATVALYEPGATQHQGPTPVRVLNLSAEGAAFAVRGQYRRGDQIRLGMHVANQPITIAARVVQVGSPVFGQSRVSCTFPYQDSIAEAIHRWPGFGDAVA